MAWIENNDVDDLELDFTDGLDHTEHDAGDDDGEEDVSPMEGAPRTFALSDVLDVNDEARAVATGSRVELVEGGEERTVTSENRNEFVETMRDYRLRGSLRAPIQAMARGLRTVMPSEVLRDARRMLSPLDFCRLLSGLRGVDVADWRRHTRYAGGLQPDAKEVKLFWNVVEVGRAPEVHGLLQFATGSRRVPVGGFAHLVGLNGGRHPLPTRAGIYRRARCRRRRRCVCTIDVPAFISGGLQKARRPSTSARAASTSTRRTGVRRRRRRGARHRRWRCGG